MSAILLKIHKKKIQTEKKEKKIINNANNLTANKQFCIVANNI